MYLSRLIRPRWAPAISRPFSSSSSSSSSTASTFTPTLTLTTPQSTTTTTQESKPPVRTNWTREEVRVVYEMPLMELVYRAATVHRAYWNPRQVQRSTLLSIKTGGCSENCGYCSQSQHNKTFVKPTPTLPLDDIVAAARRAKEAGSTRFCMGAAWREVGNKHAFKKVLEAVQEVNGMGMEVCATLGMMTEEQALQLKQAGLSYVNHNLDTSPEYYPKVVTSRSYEDRKNTLKNVRKAGLNVCCGGIIGMGEEELDRVGLIHALATLEAHPESVPINALVPVKGTPIGDALLAANKETTWDEMVRVIATARVVMPRSAVRLSAGRMDFPESAQALMFMAGANSIFTGDTLLTTSNPAFEKDARMFQVLGLEGKPANTYASEEPAFDVTEVVNGSYFPRIQRVDAEANNSASKDLLKAQRLLRIQNGPDVREFASSSSLKSGSGASVSEARGCA